MRFYFTLAAALVSLFGSSSLTTLQSGQRKPTETRIQIVNSSLYVREIGKGQPVIVLHGGPDTAFISNQHWRAPMIMKN